jgi:hypothetical protein
MLPTRLNIDLRVLIPLFSSYRAEPQDRLSYVDGSVSGLHIRKSIFQEVLRESGALFIGSFKSITTALMTW